MPAARTVAIVGGGIAGLSAALALRQRGIESTVYERAPVLSAVGAGISLWPNATRVLRSLDALAPLLDTAGPIAALNVRAPSGRVLLRAPTDGFDAPALCAYRPDLIDALRAPLPPEALVTGKTLVSVTTEADEARLMFADGTEVEADIVIGADGIRSSVRSYVAGETTEPIYRGHPIWRGIGPLPASFVPGEISETWGDGQRFGLLDVGGGRAYWYATATLPEGQSGSDGAARKAEVAARFADWHAPIPEAIAATPTEAVLGGDTYDRPPRRGWSRGRAVLIGDAAHPTTPNLGQGGCMAIEDAPVLARCLAEAATHTEAFQRFERERRRRTTRITRESLWTGRLGQATGALASARNVGARLMPGPLYTRRLGGLFDHRP
ncbi:MAG: FAD-dependent oxidoreductase [Bacteroidota bacterium]